MKKHSPFFSIVIPCLNEEKYLPLLLKDLLAQNFNDCEVILIDGKSDDQTVKKAKKFQKKLSLQIYFSLKRNVSIQRNMGAQKANGEWIVFMDADNRLPENFLETLQEQIEVNQPVDTFTCWMDSNHLPLQDKTIIQLCNIALDIYSRFKPFAPGSLIGVRKPITKSILFDEKLTLSEDAEFFRTIVNKGYKFKVFRSPNYTYSLRRFKKDGTLKIMRIYAKAQLHYVLGKKYTTLIPEYPMSGGSYYSNNTQQTIFNKYTIFLKATKKQLRQAQKLLKLMNPLNS